MSTATCLVFSFCLIGFSLGQHKELPKYLEKCSLKHNTKECVLRSANAAIPFIVKGDSKYNIPNLQPLIIPFIALVKTTEFSLNLTNLEINGASDAKLVDFVQNNKDEMSFTFTLAIPNVTMFGSYDMRGTILSMKLNGHGKFSAIFKDGTYTITVSVEDTQIDGEDYYQVKANSLIVDFQDVSFDVGNIFGSDEKLGIQVNRLLNENWRDLLKEFGPGITTIVSDIVSQIFNKIAKNIPAKDIFLQD